jgi:hypothetical protein
MIPIGPRPAIRRGRTQYRGYKEARRFQEVCELHTHVVDPGSTAVTSEPRQTRCS